MRAYSNAAFLLPLLFIYSSQLCFSTNSTSACNERERHALLQFRASFRNTSLPPLDSWEGNSCCQWKGVGCDRVSGDVIRLDLSTSSAFTLIAEDVNPSLLELEHLNYLDLSGSLFNSSSVPKFLGSMKQLRYLNLSNSFLVGKLPRHLGNLSNLQVLDVSWNEDLYDDNMDWVSKLSSLKHIAMSRVSLQKAYNLFQELYMLPSLLQAEFSSCGITNFHITRGSVNSTFLANVEVLDLSSNVLHGSILDVFQNMTSITHLDLSDNSLSSIPNWVGNLHSLVHLDLSNNQLYGSIPTSLGRLYGLVELDLSNNLLTGTVPYDLGQLVNLRILDLSNNSLHGTFSEHHLQSLTNLSVLKIGLNNLDVKIHSNWTPPFGFLYNLGMASCNISTQFPSGFRNKSGLRHWIYPIIT